METVAERECSALGGLFQLIISDLKVTSPIWEDFLTKASKLHSHLKTTTFALTAFLDAFQKVADLATNARGATKDIGTALTRLCLRHRSVETKLKIFTSMIMDNLVIPLQERLEEWKKIAYQMDKDHAKEYKRVRQEIKKKSSDTLRLQKKVRKGGKGDTKKSLNTAIQDVNDFYHVLEETEKQAVRRALLEERGRYCLFVNCLRPVVESELTTVHEVSHLQEVMDSLIKLTEDPHSLPSASEQIITDVKSANNTWSFQTPPGSPTSLGSRKSSMCSISSLNSSSGDSSKSYSPSHHRSRSLSQPPVGALRLSSVSSQDSGFTSQDTLFTRFPTPPPLEVAKELTEGCADANPDCSSPSLPFPPPPPCVTATWPNLQDTLQFDRTSATVSLVKSQRPHTISSAYERHNRPPLTIRTFHPPQADVHNKDDVDDSTLTFAEGASIPIEEQSDGDEEATPTHKPVAPPLPLKNEDFCYAPPPLPTKPETMKGRCASSPPTPPPPPPSSTFSNYEHVYVNTVDSSEETPVTSTEVKSENAENLSLKISFQKDLASALAQSIQQKANKSSQEQLATKFLHSKPVSSDQEQIETASSGPAVPRRVPQPPERRSSTRPPAIPPHRTNTQKSIETVEKETTWNVFGDSNESSSAHAQLMQALNARLSLLQQQEPRPSSEQRRHSVVLETPRPNEETVRRRPHPPSAGIVKKTARAHSLGGTEREAFLAALDSKFSQLPRTSPTLPRRSSSHRSTVQSKHFENPVDLRSQEQEASESKRVTQTRSLSAGRALFDSAQEHNIDDENDALSGAAARVHQWLAARGSVDISECRVSLLGQIREGVQLRKSHSNDRSAPSFHSFG